MRDPRFTLMLAVNSSLFGGNLFGDEEKVKLYKA